MRRSFQSIGRCNLSKKRASSKRREKEGGPGRDSVVVLHVPKGVKLPKGPGRVGGSKRDKVPSRFSRGVTLERASGLLWEEFKEKRKSSDPQDEFSRTWDEFHTRVGRIRDARENLTKVSSADSVRKLLEDALTAGRCYEKLLWRFGGPGDLALLSLEAGMDKLEGIEKASEAKQFPIVELKHKVELIRMDEPRMKRPAIADHLLEESESDSRRCHDCQRYGRAAARKAKPRCQRCERYRSYGSCTPCNLCQAWHKRLSKWVKERADGGEVDEWGERIPVTDEVQKRRNREAIKKRIERIDRLVADDHTAT